MAEYSENQLEGLNNVYRIYIKLPVAPGLSPVFDPIPICLKGRLAIRSPDI